MKYRVHKSRDGSQATVISRGAEFIASFVDGKWVRGIAFDAYQLQDILRVIDEEEAERLVNEAMESLGTEITQP